jgi:dTDP-4-amino-4,6-dideoxygalactose transaminase
MLARRQVPFFDYPGLYSEHGDEYLRTVQDVMRRGAFIMQRDLAEFEAGLAAWLGCKHVIGVADGTAALVFALRANGIGPGHEVIVSTHTFVATAAAVHHVGATPVIADCQADSMIDPASVRRLIGSKTKALMPTQLNGRTCDMEALEAIARDHDLAIVEDSCQALGARYRGKPAGLFGTVGSYSFYPAKTLGCFGDGGAVVTDSDEAADYIRQLRDHGRGADGKVRTFGHNGRLDNLQAAILLSKLARYDEALARRRAIAARYQARLADLGDLILPPPPEDGLRFDIFQNYEIQAGRRDGLRAFLAEHGIGTILQWGGWMLHQFDDLGLRADVSYAQEMVKRYMMLPMHHLLSDDDVDYVCDQIHAYYEHQR